MASKFDEAQAQFALDLFREAAKSDGTILSPVSISVALAMVYAGAAENTKLQMSQVMFNGTVPDEEVHENFAALVSKLAEVKDEYELTTANRMYVQQGMAVLPEFVDTLAKYYRNSVHSINFKTEADRTTKEINGRIADMTKQRIKNLLVPGVLTPDTRLVLVNAIYFKGAWKHQFDQSNTKKTTFHVSSNKQQEVDMMYITEYFNYSDHADCQVLGMGYKGSDLAMFVFLPRKRDGLAEFAKSLTGVRMLQLINDNQTTKVMVYLPKFKMEMSFGLSDMLSSMGMVDLFDKNKANLSKITVDEKVQVSAVIHKAFVEMNEEGSEAAAASATGEQMYPTSIRPPSPPPPEFVADHPFLFKITDKKNLLFVGRFTG